ncbi:MAG TPA: FGGY family carbohydrate kinase [Clostridium sp.]|uniref:FGGY-family carbohydrate kinase n=1 Tax=Clostridium sp. TaxID=1506 RepID=UPI002F95E4FF
MACLIGIDVGTTNCKAAAYSESGILKAMASRPTITHYLENNWAEFNPDQIWEAIQGSLKDIIKQLSGEKIDGIAVASMGSAGVLLTENDEWINRSIAWFDTRTESIAEWWNDTMGREQVYEITGFAPNPIAGITKVQWIRDNKPNQFKKVKHWLSMQDYIVYRLTGEAVVDFSVACRTMAVDLKNRCWSKDILDHARIPEEICSKLKKPGELAGKVTKKASELTDIAEGTLVYTGGMDYVCGAFACGLVESGQVLSAIGTSEQILMVTDEPANKIEHIDTNFTCVNYVVNDKYYIQGQLISSGVIMDWFHTEVAREDLSTLIQEAEKSPLGAKGVLLLPYFRGKYAPGADSRAKGAFVGLTTSHTRGDLARAILEGLCYESKVIINGLQEVTGNEVKEVNVIGGATKSQFWMQMKADILGIPVRCIDESEAVTLGVAMLAGIGAGVYKDSADAVFKTRRETKIYTPDFKKHEKYNTIFENVYKNIFPALKEMNYKIDDMIKLGGIV